MTKTHAYQQTLDELQTNYAHQDFEQGLSQTEAANRLATNGPNKLESHHTPKWQLFVRQFNNLIIYILIVAALLTLMMGHYSDAIIIGLVVIINAIIGYYQEANASDALERIKEMLATEATVYRDGQRIDIQLKT
ncbi:cation transporter/ATPase family protein [Latilactobacillus curvatus CRL 705]|nr:cation transporter/ATPase family protein [Latilactobacillus curvatus CRL 705]